MKKHLLIALTLLLTMPTMAQVARVRPKHNSTHQHNTTLTVVAPRGQQFWLYVDDVLQNEEAVHSICIRSLWDDEFYIRVELDNAQQNCVGQFIDLSQPQTLSVVQSGKLYGLDYTQAHIRPEVTIDLKVPVMPDAPNTTPPPLPLGMNPEEYEEAYQLISKESFDSSKLTVAKQVISYNPMSASQILGICKLFSFESNKLEFAKYAYTYCTEKNKYFLLNEAFSYESSKRKLDEYIKGQ